MTVNADGQLVPRAIPKTSRRLAGASPGALKTTPSLQKVELQSSLPDSVLMGLHEVTVHSDKGHTLQIKVQGFSRVPVKNSRCGNIVHFYTAWKGRITLDSTDLSFDEATAQEFKNAGFSIGVGGTNGRRLAGTSKTDGFFQNMQNIKDSGKWTCAGVPLPTQSATSVIENSNYLPCGNAAKPGVPKTGPDMCDSAYGGLIPGAGVMEKKHAMAVVSRTQRISASVNKETPQVLYVKSTSKILRSDSYHVTIDKYPQHMNQEMITVFNRKTKKTVVFQYGTDKKTRSHCKMEGIDAASDSLQKAEADKNIDTDMHFELIDTNDEDGTVLRHFRMMTSAAFDTYMSDDALKSKGDSYTEYWDIADSLTPYRILSGDGTLTVLDKVTASCSDADVAAELATRFNTTIDKLMTCSDDEKLTSVVRPTMQSPYVDLSNEDANYYETAIFGSQEDTEEVAEDEEDTTEKAKLARYLVKTSNTQAMPTWCYEKCQNPVDRLTAAMKEDQDICATGLLQTVLSCLESTEKNRCQSNVFTFEHKEECGNATTNARRMQEVDEDADRETYATMVPVQTMSDGSQVAELSNADSNLIAALADQVGMDSISNARLVFNVTRKRDAVYDKVSLVESVADRRNLITTNCNSKWGRVKWMGDGWCMKWDFKRFGFSLTIKWGNVGGKLGLCIRCEACVPILLVFAIPPPLKVELCVGGEIKVTLVWACPMIPLTIEGKVFFAVECKADFGIVSISLQRLEIGIFAATAHYKKETKCWWINGNGGGRRRYWSRRRRNIRRCNYRGMCDLKVGGYIEYTLLVVKVKFDLTYWVRGKELTVNFTLFAFEVWKLWWGGWRQMYSTTVARYKF